VVPGRGWAVPDQNPARELVGGEGKRVGEHEEIEETYWCAWLVLG
jgi:hypothetical protein